VIFEQGRQLAGRNVDCDLVVFSRLNRRNKIGTGKVRTPEYFVQPAARARVTKRRRRKC